MSIVQRHVSLESLVYHFLEESRANPRANLKSLTSHYDDLLGSTFPLLQMGYLPFLWSLGVSDPKVQDLSGHFTGRYWEFLAQYSGILRAAQAMKTLREFWIYCQKNGHIPADEPMPGDLKAPDVAHPYQVKVTIRES